MMDHINRKGEQGPTPDRTDRFYCIDGEWYFTTREGQKHGPFDSHAEAAESLTLFLTHVPKYGRQLSHG